MAEQKLEQKVNQDEQDQTLELDNDNQFIQQQEQLSQNHKENIHLFQLFAKLPYKFPLKIPETIIYGFGFEHPTYAFTSQEGFLKFTKFDENFFEIYIEKWKCLNKFNPPEVPIAIIKLQTNNQKILIFDKQEASHYFKEFVQSEDKKQLVIQRYICQLKRANLLRVTWRYNFPPKYSIISSLYSHQGKQEMGISLDTLQATKSILNQKELNQKMEPKEVMQGVKTLYGMNPYYKQKQNIDQENVDYLIESMNKRSVYSNISLKESIVTSDPYQRFLVNKNSKQYQTKNCQEYKSLNQVVQMIAWAIYKDCFVRLETLDVDFICDQDKNFYFLHIKSFTELKSKFFEEFDQNQKQLMQIQIKKKSLSHEFKQKIKLQLDSIKQYQNQQDQQNLDRYVIASDRTPQIKHIEQLSSRDTTPKRNFTPIPSIDEGMNYLS